jgi:hypothetical protein
MAHSAPDSLTSALQSNVTTSHVMNRSARFVICHACWLIVTMCQATSLSTVVSRLLLWGRISITVPDHLARTTESVEAAAAECSGSMVAAALTAMCAIPFIQSSCITLRVRNVYAANSGQLVHSGPRVLVIL